MPPLRVNPPVMLPRLKGIQDRNNSKYNKKKHKFLGLFRDGARSGAYETRLSETAKKICFRRLKRVRFDRIQNNSPHKTITNTPSEAIGRSHFGAAKTSFWRRKKLLEHNCTLHFHLYHCKCEEERRKILGGEQTLAV